MKKIFLSFLLIAVLCPSLIFAQQLSLSLGQGGAICRDNSVQLSSTVTGGTPPYYYHLTPSTGLSDSTISNPIGTPLTTTTYTLFVKDSSGDSVNHSVTITVNARPQASFTVDTSSTNCPPLLCTFTSTSTGAIAFRYDFGNGESSNSENTRHLYTLPGTYHPSLIVTNASGCTDTFYLSDSIVVGGPKLISFSVTPSSGCAPLTVTFIVISNAFHKIWGTGDTTISTDRDTIIHTYYHPGVYQNFVILSLGACNLPLYLDTVLVFSDTVSVISSNLSVCKGDTIPLEVTGANTYTIIPGLVQLNNSTFLAHPAINTTYKIIGTDIHGCVDSITTTVNVDTSCISTGIPIVQLQHDFNLNIYPNPASDKIIIAFVNDVADELQIQNLLGETVLILNHLQQTNTIDVSALPVGIYSLIVTSKQNRLVRKIAVQR